MHLKPEIISTMNFLAAKDDFKVSHKLIGIYHSTSVNSDRIAKLFAHKLLLRVKVKTEGKFGVVRLQSNFSTLLMKCYCFDHTFFVLV